jgi:hypothetical protein
VKVGEMITDFLFSSSSKDKKIAANNEQQTKSNHVYFPCVHNKLTGNTDARKKMILFDFLTMLAACANVPELHQLKCESGDMNDSAVKALRKARHGVGIFAAESDTRSFTAYVKYIDYLLAKNDKLAKQDPAPTPKAS